MQQVKLGKAPTLGAKVLFLKILITLLTLFLKVVVADGIAAQVYQDGTKRSFAKASTSVPGVNSGNIASQNYSLCSLSRRHERRCRSSDFGS